MVGMQCLRAATPSTICPVCTTMLYNKSLQLKMGRCRCRARSAKQFRRCLPQVPTPADGNCAWRGRFSDTNSVGRFPAHFS